MIGTWPCTLPGGTVSEELVVRLGDGSGQKILIIPPLFGEHNLMRRQLVQLMRRLTEAGIGAVLPDLPGWNESLEPLETQTLAFWREAMVEAAQVCGATHVLAFRSGAVLTPPSLQGWSYAPQSGAKLLRGMVRARTIASRESGQPETSEDIYTLGRKEGAMLAGWPISATMFAELELAEPPKHDGMTEIKQGQVGGPALWLRAEAAEDAEQVASLASIIGSDLAEPAA